VLEEGRRDEIAVVAAVLAAGEQFPALATTLLDGLEDGVVLAPVVSGRSSVRGSVGSPITARLIRSSSRSLNSS
jgi:hypothetical protein